MLNALLLQVSPGHEDEVINEIIDKIGKDYVILSGFGRYDLAILCEKNDFSLLRKFHEVNLPHIVDWYPVWGLKWNCKASKEGTFSKDVAVLGLSFIKLDIDYSINNKNSPILDELIFVQNLLTKCECNIYCGLGFSELIVITPAKSMEELAEKILFIKKNLIIEEKSLAADISTIPFFNPKTYNSSEKLLAYLLLSLRIGLTVSFKKKLDEIVGKTGESIFGFHDRILKLSGNAAEIFKKIIEIRKAGIKNGLCTSFTIISHPDEELNFSVEPLEKKLVASEKILDEQQQKEPQDIDEQLSFYKTWLQTSRRDPTIKHHFQDTILFFKQIDNLNKSNCINHSNNQNNIFKSQRLDNLHECLRIGFEQRSSGIAPGNQLRGKAICTEPLGSIQRATQAIESLPIFLFNKLNKKTWPGFCIHGFASRFYRTEGGIINIPEKFRLEPEMWWGIYHEIGHELFLKTDLYFKYYIRNELTQLLKIATHKNIGIKIFPEDLPDIEIDIMLFIEEIFAELFGFHFGFHDKWSLYLEKVWSYFAEELELDFMHLSRSVLAYFAFGPGKDSAKDEITAEKIETCVAQIQNIIKKANGKELSQQQIDDTFPIVWAFLDVSDIIRSFLLKKEDINNLDNFDQINNELKRGKIVISDNPVQILLSLISTGNKHEPKHQFATILSLCNCYYQYMFLENIG